jgi:hypothetical protein
VSFENSIKNNPVIWLLGIAFASCTATASAIIGVIGLTNNSVVEKSKIAAYENTIETLKAEVSEGKKKTASLEERIAALDSVKKENDNAISRIRKKYEDSAYQDSIQLRHVEFNLEEDVERYRLVMEVDGIPHSYPGKTVWKMHGPKFPEQSFPLVAGRKSHTVSLRLFIRKKDGSIVSAYSENSKIMTRDSGVQTFGLLKESNTFSRAGASSAHIKVEVVKT